MATLAAGNDLIESVRNEIGIVVAPVDASLNADPCRVLQ